MNRRELAQLRRDLYRDSLETDSLAQHLEFRVLAIETVIAARGWRRIIAAARLGRHLRESARYFPGESFAERRTAAVTADWLADDSYPRFGGDSDA